MKNWTKSFWALWYFFGLTMKLLYPFLSHKILHLVPGKAKSYQRGHHPFLTLAACVPPLQKGKTLFERLEEDLDSISRRKTLIRPQFKKCRKDMKYFRNSRVPNPKRCYLWASKQHSVWGAMVLWLVWLLVVQSQHFHNVFLHWWNKVVGWKTKTCQSKIILCQHAQI